MSEESFRRIEPYNEIEWPGWCMISAFDCVSIGDIDRCGYGVYYQYFEKYKRRKIDFGLFRYIVERCIEIADRGNYDYIDYYEVRTYDELLVALDGFRRRRERVMIQVSEGHMMGLKPMPDGKWKIIGSGDQLGKIVNEQGIFESLYISPEPNKKKRLPNFVVVGPEKQIIRR